MLESGLRMHLSPGKCCPFVFYHPCWRAPGGRDSSCSFSVERARSQRRHRLAALYGSWSPLQAEAGSRLGAWRGRPCQRFFLHYRGLTIGIGLEPPYPPPIPVVQRSSRRGRNKGLKPQGGYLEPEAAGQHNATSNLMVIMAPKTSQNPGEKGEGTRAAQTKNLEAKWPPVINDKP
ncbi:hypothetical protein NDU88_003419 [Pleurodeles waltl]|uniref:Uncharacterized protein n=1 Tax=Pleurodeles waltl TaxID=8319 RepID=A0AAV7T513_PLEWA|nr:hypothetical protein NDU88_003419 [Pleurodeles waltl]